MNTVIVYSQPGCMPCRATMRKLDSLGVDYEHKDVHTDKAAADHINAGGWRSTPVVEVVRDGAIVSAWSGLRPDALKALGTPGADMGQFDTRGLTESTPLPVDNDEA